MVVFYRDANAIFGKIKTVWLVSSKRMLVLLYGLEASMSSKSVIINRLDFVVNGFS